MAINDNEVYYAAQFSASLIVKRTHGNCGGILVSSGTGTITVYDGLSASGTKIIDTITVTAGQQYAMPFMFETGLYIAVTGTVSGTVFYT